MIKLTLAKNVAFNIVNEKTIGGRGRDGGGGGAFGAEELTEGLDG